MRLVLSSYPPSVNLLAEHGWKDLVEVSYLLSTIVPARISIPLQPGASAHHIDATLEDLVQTIATAKATDRENLPDYDGWLRSRSVKAWGNWNEALADHRMFMAQWPKIFGAYVSVYCLLKWRWMGGSTRLCRFNLLS